MREADVRNDRAELNRSSRPRQVRSKGKGILSEWLLSEADR